MQHGDDPARLDAMAFGMETPRRGATKPSSDSSLASMPAIPVPGKPVYLVREGRWDQLVIRAMPVDDGASECLSIKSRSTSCDGTPQGGSMPCEMTLRYGSFGTPYDLTPKSGRNSCSMKENIVTGRGLPNLSSGHLEVLLHSEMTPETACATKSRTASRDFFPTPSCSTTCSTADSTRPRHTLQDQLEELDQCSFDIPPGIPTIGSMKHAYGTCKPCAFVFKNGCSNGLECKFCHLCEPGERQRRKKAKRALYRSHPTICR